MVDVRPRDCCQVGQPGGAELFDELGGHSGGVPDDQCWHQSGWAGWQSGDRLPKTVAHRVHPLIHHAGSSDHLRCCPGRCPGGDGRVVARRELHQDRHGASDRRLPPRVQCARIGADHNAAPAPPRHAPAVQAVKLDGSQPHLAARTGIDHSSLSEPSGDRYHRTLRGEVGHRPAGHHRSPPRAQAGRHPQHQHGGDDQAKPPPHQRGQHHHGHNDPDYPDLAHRGADSASRPGGGGQDHRAEIEGLTVGPARRGRRRSWAQSHPPPAVRSPH